MLGSSPLQLQISHCSLNQLLTIRWCPMAKKVQSDPNPDRVTSRSDLVSWHLLCTCDGRSLRAILSWAFSIERFTTRIELPDDEDKAHDYHGHEVDQNEPSDAAGSAHKMLLDTASRPARQLAADFAAMTPHTIARWRQTRPGWRAALPLLRE